jgi:hypothetical protein
VAENTEAATAFRISCAEEFAAKCARNVNETSAFLPAAPPLFELTGTGIFRTPAFAFLAVSTVDFKRHIRPATILARCTPLHAEEVIFL